MSAAVLVANYCRTRGYPEPEAEFRFHPVRKWRFDLAWPAEFIAVEFQGGAWVRGRHTRGAGFTADCEKLSVAAVLGWRVLPVVYAQVDDGRLFGWLDELFEQKTP